MSKLRLTYKLVPLITSLWLLGGCASISSENSYDVSVLSVPTDVPFTITDGAGQTVAEGTTPQIVHLDSYAGFFKAAKYLVSYAHPENGKSDVPLNGKFNVMYLLNYPFGAWFGFIIDPFTGAVYDLPNQVSADLTTEPVEQGVVK